MLLVTTAMVEFYIWNGVLGWVQPISTRVCQMGTIALSIMKKTASSASASEDMKNLIIWDMVRMDPLSRVTGSSPDRKMWDPDRLRSLKTLRYASSECPASIMLLA